MMEMNCEGTLLMPTNCVLMDEEEMTYVDGGLNANQLYVSTSYLNKANCMSAAKNYMSATGLAQLRIAKEIYAHTVLYYGGVAAFTVNNMQLISNIFTKTAVNLGLSYIIQHSNPIDLGGDSALRVKIFDIMWGGN